MSPASTISWIEQLGTWLPGGSNDLTVLSIDGQWLKLLHAKGLWRARTVTALIAIPLQGLSETEVVSRLREACQRHGIEPSGVLVANPSHLTTTRVFAVPSADPNEIKDIVDLQAEKHTPYAKEEILSDFSIIETDASGYSRVMLIISHQDVIHRAVRLTEAMGWPLERVGFELDGLVGWFRWVRGAERQATLVAELDAETTTLVVIQHGKPYVHRSLPFGTTQLIAEPSGAPSRLVAELRRSLDAFEAEGTKLAIEGLVLTGQVERLPDLADELRRELDLATTVMLPFERIALSECAAAAQQELTHLSFASLLGLAVSPSAVDLTPKPLRLHRVFEQRARALVGLGCQFIAGAVLIAAIIIGKAHQEERYHAWLTKEYQRTTQDAEDLELALKQLELAQGWLSSRGQFLDGFVTLSKYSSDAIRWESLDFTKHDRIVVKGISREMPRVYEMVAALKRAPQFAQVEARKVAKRREGDEDLTNFEITCVLKSTETSAAPTSKPSGIARP